MSFNMLFFGITVQVDDKVEQVCVGDGHGEYGEDGGRYYRMHTVDLVTL